jgi:hypothetical protein
MCLAGTGQSTGDNKSQGESGTPCSQPGGVHVWSWNAGLLRRYILGSPSPRGLLLFLRCAKHASQLELFLPLFIYFFFVWYWGCWSQGPMPLRWYPQPSVGTFASLSIRITLKCSPPCILCCNAISLGNNCLHLETSHSAQVVFQSVHCLQNIYPYCIHKFFAHGFIVSLLHWKILNSETLSVL